MHNSLGYTFVIKVRNLFTQNKVFQQSRSTLTSAQRVLIVGYEKTLIGGNRRIGRVRLLVRFTTFYLTRLISLSVRFDLPVFLLVIFLIVLGSLLIPAAGAWQPRSSFT